MKKIKFIAIISAALVFSQACFGFSPKSEEDKKAKECMEMMNGVFEFVRKNYVDEVDPAVLYKGALKGMLESLDDQHTLYLDHSMSRSLSDTTSGQFGGVGLSISKPFENKPDKPAYVEVASPVEDTPGFRAGIVAGDLIIKANGVDTSTITMEEVLDILRGKVGEKVDLVIRRGKTMEFPVTLTRAIIEVPTVKFGTIGKLGYLKIIEFTPLTSEKVQQALDSFESAGITGLIIDLRNNPGGLITSVADVADKFIDDGPIVSTKSRLEYENTVFSASPRKTTFKNKPIVVLINKGSASASEILSGALKDNHLAYLVGQRSYGKGSVQQVIPLSKEDSIKITMARYYTPSDVNIDKIGIPPDREFLFPELGEEGEKQYIKLLEGSEVEKYVENHPGMTENDISNYAVKLHVKYPDIDERTLRKNIRNEVHRTIGTMLYDLDYDVQLNEAIRILEKENFKKLMSKTKTLKQLQDAVELGEKRDDGKNKSKK